MLNVVESAVGMRITLRLMEVEENDMGFLFVWVHFLTFYIRILHIMNMFMQEHEYLGKKRKMRLHSVNSDILHTS